MEHGKNLWFFAVTTIIFFLLPAFNFPPTNCTTFAADFISGSGCSVSNIGYLSDVAKEYERRTGVKVLVRGGGSVVGIEDLRNGKVDFAAACRARAASDPIDIQFVQVAWDALVFIVHPSNPVTSITKENIRAILENRISDWKELGWQKAPIKIFLSRSKQGLSGVEASTNQLILSGKKPAETGQTVFLASTGIVEQMVERTPEGFAVTGFTSGRKRNVKMLKVNGVSPTAANIISGRYPFRRPLFLLLPKKPKPEVQKFVDYILSKDGQQYLKSLNVVSLRDIK